jgi:hypothetical protein
VLIVLPLFFIGIGSLVIAIMTAVTASRYPDYAFQQTGSSKFIWVGLPIILLFLCGFAGGVMGIVWFSSKRAAVEAAARGGGPPYGYGAPGQYGYGAPPPGGWGPPSAGWSPPQTPPPPGAPPPPVQPWPPPEQPQ